MRRRNTKKSNMRNPTEVVGLNDGHGPSLCRGLSHRSDQSERRILRGRVNKLNVQSSRLSGFLEPVRRLVMPNRIESENLASKSILTVQFFVRLFLVLKCLLYNLKRNIDCQVCFYTCKYFSTEYFSKNIT